MKGHYLSPEGGGEAEDFRGDHLILERKKGRSVVTENPKGGIAENFGRGRTTQICLENEDMEGGSRKSSKVIRGHHFSEVAFKGEMFYLAQNPPPPRR